HKLRARSRHRRRNAERAGGAWHELWVRRRMARDVRSRTRVPLAKDSVHYSRALPLAPLRRVWRSAPALSRVAPAFIFQTKPAAPASATAHDVEDRADRFMTPRLRKDTAGAAVRVSA